MSRGVLERRGGGPEAERTGVRAQETKHDLVDNIIHTTYELTNVIVTWV